MTYRCLFISVMAVHAAAQTHAAPIEVRSVLIKLIEQVDVPARESGVLADLAVTEGSIVDQGTVLAKLDDEEAKLLQLQARLQLEIATKKAQDTIDLQSTQEALRVAQADLERARASRERFSTSISKSELEHLQLDVIQRELGIKRTRRDLEIAKVTLALRQKDFELASLNLDRRKIVAPLSGMVVQVHRRRGEWVEPGENVVRIIRLDRLRAEGFVNVQDVQDELQGASVRLHVDLPGRARAAFAGRIVFVSPEIDPVNRQVRVWAEVENGDLQLRPGLRATMTVDAAAGRLPSHR